MFLIKILCQFVKDSLALSTSVKKTPTPFKRTQSIRYLHSFLQLTSTSLQNLSYNKKSLQKSLYTQQKKLPSLTRDCNVPIFKAYKTITNLMQYELSQDESNLLKACFYFSIQQDKIRRSEIFTTFQKIHCSFLNNPKSEETKS